MSRTTSQLTSQAGVTAAEAAERAAKAEAEKKREAAEKAAAEEARRAGLGATFLSAVGGGMAEVRLARARTRVCFARGTQVPVARHAATPPLRAKRCKKERLSILWYDSTAVDSCV